jgi:hypothetical protein
MTATHCKTCGTEVQTGTNFCASCGAPIDDYPPTDNTIVQTPADYAPTADTPTLDEPVVPAAQPNAPADYRGYYAGQQPQPSDDYQGYYANQQPQPTTGYDYGNPAAQPHTTASYAASAATAKPKLDPKKLIVPIVAAAVVLVAAIVGVYFLTRTPTDDDGGNSPNGEGNPTDSDTTAGNKGDSQLEAALASILGNAETIDNVSILERETDEEMGIDTIWCKVESNDTEVAYIKYFKTVFRFYETEGWVLDSFSQDKTDQWTSAPIAGPKDDLIRAAVMDLQIIVDGEEWYADDETVGNVDVIGRDSQFNMKRETVTVSVELQSDALIATGEMQIEFTYSDGWAAEDRRVTVPFATAYKPGAELDVTDETVLSIISGKSMTFGDTERTAQTLTIKDAEISDFSILGVTTSEKGTIRIYECSLNLSKSPVVFSANATLAYEYDKVNGWKSPEVSFGTPKVVSVDTSELEGGWTGWLQWDAYATHPTLSLVVVISEIANDGTVVATVSCPEDPFSFSADGYFDKDALIVTLNFKEWIGREPGLLDGRDLKKRKLRGCLFVEEYEIKSTERLYVHLDYNDFSITKSD